MLKFLKKKEFEVYAPTTGIAIPLDDVPDAVFAQRMMGEGLAFKPQSEMFCAPQDGKLTMIAPTKHAYGLTMNDGTELLVHIGIDTVNLNGEGFEVLASEGTTVKKGTPIIKADIAFFESKGISMITPLIVLNKKDIAIRDNVIGNAVDTDTVVIIKA